MRLEISLLAGLRRPKVLPSIATTKAQARNLARIYVQPLNAWREAAGRLILPAYERSLSALTHDDAIGMDIEIKKSDDGIISAILGAWRASLDQWAAELSVWHMRKFTSNLKYSTDIDLGTILPSLEGPETVEVAVARNVALIRNISDQARARIADIVLRGLQQRQPAREVAKEIATAIGMGRKRALRIASDQTVKLSAALDRQRMAELGIEEFEWQHSFKAHPREWHKARHGKRFRFDDPKLRGDLPGDQPFCGCKAKGVISDG